MIAGSHDLGRNLGGSPRVLSAQTRRVRRLAAVLPVALLAALAASQTVVRADADGISLTLDARLAGVLVAIVAIRFRAPFLLVIVLAAATTAGLRLIG